MEQRQIIYCLVPADQARTLLAPLRKHFAKDPRVQVIVDRRVRERRANRDDTSQSPVAMERRAGSDRRRPVLPRSLKPLPKRLAAMAERVDYVQRMLPLAAHLAREDLDAIVARVRDGDDRAPTELYWRLYQRMHSRLSVKLGDVTEADLHVLPAFGRLLDAIEASDELTPLDEILDAAVGHGLEARRIDEDQAPVLDDRPSLAIRDEALDEPVSVQDRDPRWFGRAMSERDRLTRQGSAYLVAVEHIGGTAVPAMPGRPVVDLMIGVEAMPPAPELVSILLEIGYEDCGHAGNPVRRLFRRRRGGRFDVHVVEHGGELWRDAVAMREFLRRRPYEAHRWAAARREAARSAPWSYVAYVEARAAALAELLEKVRAHGENPQDAETPLPAA